MRSLSEDQLLYTLLALGVILVFARTGGELARRTRQPEVLGELFAGFVLGPSFLGALFPSVYHTLFLTPAISLVLSGFSWVGAIMLLLVAGMEVDLGILRTRAKSGIFAAGFAIVPSLIAGTLFGWLVLGKLMPGGFFLGVVLSVTAVSVVAKVLMERGAMRRQYAQVMMAAGIASEVLVWLLVSVASPGRGHSPFIVGGLRAVYAVAFFIFMLTVGRRFVFWAMRRVRDATWIIKGQLSLVLLLSFGAAAITQALGLHALLGAFVFGVLLSQAPRANPQLLDGIQSLTIGLFAPIFFVIAGMRVDVLQLGSLSAVGIVLLLFAVATAVKIGFSTVGARLGGQCTWEALLVGTGLNLKGGTDVVVAVVGVELGLLTARMYTMYTIVAILTVLFSPSLLAALERKAPPSTEEQERLAMEEAGRRSYVPRIERVLVPVMQEFLPVVVARVVEHIAASKHEQGQVFDISEITVEPSKQPMEGIASRAQEELEKARGRQGVEVRERHVDDARQALDAMLASADTHDLIAVGARPPCSNRPTFGKLQDRVIHRARADVLVISTNEDDFHCEDLRCILVPVGGLEYSLAAGDIAASIAHSCHAELVAFHVVRSSMSELFWRERDRRRLLASAGGVTSELAFRASRVGVRVHERIETADDIGEAILRELERNEYQAVVLGVVDRGGDDYPYLGRTVMQVLQQSQVPVVMLVSRESAGGNGV